MKISGKTHTSVRYFAKKHATKNPQVIIDKLKETYPLLYKYFPPELRKIHDIGYRENKGKEPEGVKLSK